MENNKQTSGETKGEIIDLLGPPDGFQATSGNVLAPQSFAPGTVTPAALVYHVKVYWNGNFQGITKDHYLPVRFVGAGWNDKISSIIVISGTWRFFDGRDYDHEHAHWDLGPGYYPILPDYGVHDDAISSFAPVDFLEGRVR